MGVRGLTTYIERNKSKYLKKHNLRDTYLVIDGNSLCAQLYQSYAKCNDIFGGDYDKFGKCIETFFSMLQQCNIKPIVIFDGGYEAKKLRTVNSRLHTKLRKIRNATPVCADSVTIFPLFLREAFKDTLLKLKIPLMRCDYEADLEIACAARQLDCPVLSYDSDFYIFDCLYIPFNTMDFYVTRISDGNGSKYCINCSIFNIKTFLKHHKIDKPLLPLMATLLGNDFVKRSVFAKFYTHIKLPKKNGSRSLQHRTIIALIDWMQNKTYDTAVKIILGRVKRHQRFRLASILTKVSQGYFGSHSETLEYLGITGNNIEEYKVSEINTEEINSESENEDENSSESEISETNSLNSDNEITEEDNIGEDLTEIIENKTVTTLKSEWFKKNIRNGNFPTLFTDILTLNIGIYTPQVEDVSNIQSFYIFIPILQGICKILLENSKEKTFNYLARNENSHVKKYNFKVLGIDLPKLQNIETLEINKRRKCLLRILQITENEFQGILKFPKDWQLYLLSLLYWTKKAQIPTVTYNHISCIVICLLHLNIIDKKQPNLRKSHYFKQKYEPKIKTILEQRKSEKETNETKQVKIETVETNLTTAIKNINTDDVLFFIESFISNFETDEKLKTNRNLFTLSIVDAFAQFQSCLLHIKYLNALLNFPLPTFNICEFYNGTYLYNLYTNFEKRTNIDNYIELMLRNSTSLLCIFKKIVNILNPIVKLTPLVPSNKRSRKRKRRNTKKEESSNEEEAEKKNSEPEDYFHDENNIFSILSIVN